MAYFRDTLTAVAALALGITLAAAPSMAQEAGQPAAEAPAAAAPAPGTEFNAGVEDGPQIGQDYITETHDAWEIRCVKTSDGFDPCRIYQLLVDADQNPVAEFSLVALPAGSEATSGATIITPLETLLTAQLALNIDSAATKRYPFTWCSQIGCFSRIGFSNAELASLKGGKTATVTIVPVLAPDQQVKLTASLTGFTAAYAAMEKANNETQKRAEEAMKAAGAAAPSAN